MRILTFDIEDWFHLLDNETTRSEADWARFPSRIEFNVDRILQLLETRRQKATFFTLGWVARKHPNVVRKIVDAGHRVGSHSDMHQLVYEQSRREFVEDLRRSIDSLQQASGQAVRLYRAPGFSVIAGCEWAFEEVVKAGIELDCSLFPAQRAHGGLAQWKVSGPAMLDTPSGPLKLLPMSIYRRMGLSLPYSGGGYFRLLPFGVLRGLFARQPYVMTYFHPRDFDPDQPIVPGLSPHRRFKSYVGLSGAKGKLDRLLGTMEFIDVDTAEKALDWTTVPRLRLSEMQSLAAAQASSRKA